MSYTWDQQQQQQQQQQYGSGWDDGSSFSYDMGGMEFGQEQSFQSFEYSSGGPAGAGGSGGATSMFTPGPAIMTPGVGDGVGVSDVPGVVDEDEQPLLEELGINPDAILQKTLTVLNTLRRTDPAILRDTDLAGPLAFCLALGSFLLLAGKAQFGHIYGIGTLGCASMYGLLNAMSLSGVGLGVVVSVLGYCLLPMVALAGLATLLPLGGPLGTVLTGTAILWCSFSASKLFSAGLAMHHQQPLVAYPCALLYAVFALITIF